MTITKYLCPTCNRVFESNEIVYVPPVRFDDESNYDGYYGIGCPLCGKYITVWEDDWKAWLLKFRVE